MGEFDLFGFRPVSSVSYDNDEIIQSIMRLYDIDRFDLDCTYSIGEFWSRLPDPRFKSDLKARFDDVIEASSTNLPFDDDSMNSIMFDPPFVISGQSYAENAEGSSITAKRFEGFTSFKELRDMYWGTMLECRRILAPEGILVVKCQDTVSGGLNHFTHCMISDMAVQLGMYPKDLFILIAKSRLNSFGGKWENQYHARKYHSYFWVIQNVKCRVDYQFGEE